MRRHRWRGCHGQAKWSSWSNSCKRVRDTRSPPEGPTQRNIGLYFYSYFYVVLVISTRPTQVVFTKQLLVYTCYCNIRSSSVYESAHGKWETLG